MAGAQCCDRICDKYKVTGRDSNGNFYWNGVKRCSSCEVRIFWEGRFCPCCKTRLRSKPVHQRASKQRRDEMVKRF